MRVNPFSGYLDHFPIGYQEAEISKEQLIKADFPINTDILMAYWFGLTPIKLNGKEVFNVQELIGFTRLYSIPNEGFISKEPIRAAEILDTETIEDEATGKNRIRCVKIAAAFMPPENRRRGSGHMVFICPFCGCTHYHGAGGKKHGDGDGLRVPHCTCSDNDFFRINTQHFGKLLYSDWQFNLVETYDPIFAGEFPKHIAKRIINRFK